MGRPAGQEILPWEGLGVPTAPGLRLASAQSGISHRPAYPVPALCLGAQMSPENPAVCAKCHKGYRP